MGAFSTYAMAYLAVAFTFQAIALLFTGTDGACRSNRFGWLVLVFFTGPVGLAIYFFRGRE